MIYLAVPYSHPDKAVRHARFLAANRAAFRLMKMGEVVFSPISHSHPIEIESGVIGDHEFWAKQDDAFQDKCEKLAVLKIDGWKESRGVQREINRATESGIIITFLEPEFAEPIQSEKVTAYSVAVEVTGGDRKADYGQAYDNHRRIALNWTSILDRKLSEPITPKEAALMMIGTKLIREAHRTKFDNLVDIHGYTKLIDEDPRFTA